MNSDAVDCNRTPAVDADKQACGGESDAVPGVAPRVEPLARLADLAASRAGRLGATLVAGLLLYASFPLLDWWWAAVVAFALLSWVLTCPATSSAGGAGYGVLFGLAFYLPLLLWTSDFVGPWPWLALAMICALYPGLFGLLAVLVCELPGWPIWFAALWSTQEWAKSSFPFGGFPWGTVSFGQTTGPLLPLVALGGTPLLSVAVVVMGCAATAVMIATVRYLRGVGIGARHYRAVVPTLLAPGTSIFSVVVATTLIAPQVHHSGAGSGNELAVTVAAVQGNVPRLGYDFNAQRRAVLDNHVRETMQLADEVNAERAPAPRIVIWPENSSDIDPLANSDAAQQITAAAHAIDAPILVGMIRAAPGSTREYPTWMNTVWVFDPRTGWGERHDKVIIQPFGEYLPWRPFFRLLSEHADDAGYFVAGQGNGVVRAAGIPVGVATCWEVLFDRSQRGAVLNGAQLLAVPTNNATFDATMSSQQLAVAKTRAVEHDRYMVVAGTTGISAVIAPDGRVVAQTGFNQSAYLDIPVHLETRLTLATRWCPALQWMLVGVGLGAAIAAVAYRFRRPRQ